MGENFPHRKSKVVLCVGGICDIIKKIEKFFL